MPFYLEMSKNTTQQRDICDIYISVCLCVWCVRVYLHYSSFNLSIHISVYL